MVVLGKLRSRSASDGLAGPQSCDWIALLHTTGNKRVYDSAARFKAAKSAEGFRSQEQTAGRDQCIVLRWACGNGKAGAIVEFVLAQGLCAADEEAGVIAREPSMPYDRVIDRKARHQWGEKKR